MRTTSAEPPRRSRGAVPHAWLLLGAIALAVGLLAQPRDAAAYCRTSVCGSGAGAVCVPAQSTDCGVPLFWNRSCFGMSLQEDASNQVALETVRSRVLLAFAAWQAADCGNGAQPGIRIKLDEDVECNDVEYNQTGGNANIITFRDNSWPHDGMGNTLALTTVTYNEDTAEIYDADLEVNSTPSIEITVGDTGVKFDLQSILTHEAGHVLGLAHSERVDATMYQEYIPGDTTIRELSDDDVTAICVAYPPKDISSCDIEPRHGFKSSCGPEPDETEGSCACSLVTASSDSAPGRSGLAATLMLLGIAFARRWRRRM